MIELELHGGKGGAEKPHTPVETPNNLISIAKAKVLIAVAEGELAGRPTDRDIFLDGTPLVNADGSSNFGGVKWEWRSGSVDQEYIQGLPEVSTEFNINYEVRDQAPWVREVTTPNLDAVRVTFNWPALLESKTNGDVVGYTMDYAIDLAVNGGAFQEYSKYTVSGKTSNGYDRTHRVDLPKDTTRFTIRARRITADSQSGTIQDTMNIRSYAEVVDVKQRYPNTALLYVEFDSRMFGNSTIPKVSVRTKGRIIRVPSNYDPETRTYTGVWAGDFKQAWSDNPAWVYYDILTQDRFGLGHKVTPAMVDKFALYEVAQYCDVMVGDGEGGMQPRHTCNIYIAQKAGAWKVLRDIASIFNGMTYWNGNQFVAIADKEEDISNIPVFSRSNVVNGRFDYQAADDKSIYTSALVSYDDPDNHFGTQVEAVFEREQILRWGADRQVEISAIGCTSRGEAQRKGKYTLLTNMFNRTVKFQTGLQGLNDQVLPGRLIQVTDPLIGGRAFTGRIKSQTGRVITLDRDVVSRAGDIMYLTKPNGLTEGRTVESVQGNIVTVTLPYSVAIEPGAVWYLEASDLKSQLFRVTKITSPSENIFEIEGVEYNESKYGAIDNGARLEPRPISVVPSNAQESPKNVTVSSYSYVEQTMAVSNLVVQWDQTPNAVSYEVQWKVDNGDWVNAGITGVARLEVKGIYTGLYVGRVRAINALGIRSVWSNSVATQLNGKVGSPPALASLTTTPMLFGIRLDWQFKDGSTDTLFTQMRYSENASFASSIPLSDFAYPTDSHEMHGLKAGQQFWFWARLKDRTGNVGPWYPLETGAGINGKSLDNAGGAYNDYFAGLISETALDKTLYDRIELIDGNGPGSVNERIEVVDDRVTETNTKLDNAVADLEDQIANITDALAYDPTKTYLVNDIVRQGQKLYQAIAPVPVGKAPPDPLYWKDIGTIISDVNGLAVQVQKNTADIITIDGQVKYQASSLESLQAAYRDDDGEGQLNDALNSYGNRASINEERIVRAGQDEALAQRIISLKAEVDTNEQSNSAKITTLEKTVADGDSALSTRIDSLSASTTTEFNKVNANITTETTARTTADEALASDIQTLTATMQTEDGKLGARISTEETARANADGALATRIDTVVAATETETQRLQAAITAETTARTTADSALATRVDKVTADLTTETSQRQAAVTSESTARVDGDTALGSRIDIVRADLTTETSQRTAAITTEETARIAGDNAISQRVDTIEAGLITDTQVKALIQVETTARVNADSALGQRIDTVQASAGANTAAIQEVRTAQATTDGKVNTAWTLKMEAQSNGQYVAAGIGLGIENGPAGLQSQFLVRADRFAVVAGLNGTTSAPFVVSGGQVFINDALINKATITNAIIGSTLVSSQVTNWGPQAMTMQFDIGRIALHNMTRANTYTEMDTNGVRVYVDGVLRVRMGVW